jgi:hypothetical protein
VHPMVGAVDPLLKRAETMHHEAEGQHAEQEDLYDVALGPGRSVVEGL